MVEPVYTEQTRLNTTDRIRLTAQIELDYDHGLNSSILNELVYAEKLEPDGFRTVLSSFKLAGLLCRESLFCTW